MMSFLRRLFRIGRPREAFTPLGRVLIGVAILRASEPTARQISGHLR